MVNHPSHYQAEVYGKVVEVIEVVEAYRLGYHLGQCVAYILRSGRKSSDALEDLKKAAWYLARHVRFTEGRTLEIDKSGKVSSNNV
ncbi:MAG: DUF3310 domain-containing protein [Nitrososphaerota archaeon]